jgi:hypothetical protein
LVQDQGRLRAREAIIRFSYGYQLDIYLEPYLFLRHSGTVLDAVEGTRSKLDQAE